MIANIKLEGHVNRIVQLDNQRYTAFDESFRYCGGEHADQYVCDLDPELDELLWGLCEMVPIADDEDAEYDVDLLTSEITNLKLTKVVLS